MRSNEVYVVVKEEIHVPTPTPMNIRRDSPGGINKNTDEEVIEW